VLAVGVIALLAVPGLASADWGIQPVKGPGTRGPGTFGAVSCVSRTFCVAVGRSMENALAGRWDGRRWSLSTLPHAPQEWAIELLDVSCASSESCIAVGRADGGIPISAGMVVQQTTTLAERWDGRTWSRLPTPTPAAPSVSGVSSAALQGISCTANTSCTAVGAYDYVADRGRVGTLVERWDGTSWTIQTSADPPAGGDLLGVSCPSTNFCTSVGYVESWDFARALAEHWAGLQWSIQPTPQPPISRLADVSCASIVACVAVGTFQLYSGGTPSLVERWDGNRWLLEKIARPSEAASDSGLSGVSCTSGAVCHAVGAYYARTGHLAPLIERRGGTGWSVAATPAVAGSNYSRLGGVSCTSGICTAVGSYDDQAGLTHPLVMSTVGPWLTPASADLVGIPPTCTNVLVASVHRRGISSVRWWLDDRRISGRTIRSGTTDAASVGLTPGRHQLTARVTFVTSSQTPPHTFRKTVTGCSPPATGLGSYGVAVVKASRAVGCPRGWRARLRGRQAWRLRDAWSGSYSRVGYRRTKFRRESPPSRSERGCLRGSCS